METGITKTEGQSLTALDIRMQVNLIQEVMKAVMKEGEHYGKIPGCGDKLTLLKAGAEKLLSTFRIAAEPLVEDLSTHDEARYRVTVRGLNMATGAFLGAGIGECSSSEEKYRWKKASCQQEFDAVPEDRRRVKWFAPYNKAPYSVNQIRTAPADVANTVLKMAKKRAQIDMALTVTAASDIFTQDIEDPEDLAATGEVPPTTKPATEAPKAKSTTPAPAPAGDLRKMSAKFASKCGTCGEAINVGEEILYDSANKKAHHPACVNKTETTEKTDAVEF